MEVKQELPEEGEMSYPESKVKEFLNEKYLDCEYEQPIFIKDDKDRPRVWSPDFYLKDFGIYVEVCGAKRRAYKYRQEIYKKNKIPIIFVKTYMGDAWKKYLIQRIKEIEFERSKIISSWH